MRQNLKMLLKWFYNKLVKFDFCPHKSCESQQCALNWSLNIIRWRLVNNFQRITFDDNQAIMVLLDQVDLFRLMINVWWSSFDHFEILTDFCDARILKAYVSPPALCFWIQTLVVRRPFRFVATPANFLIFLVASVSILKLRDETVKRDGETRFWKKTETRRHDILDDPLDEIKR